MRLLNNVGSNQNRKRGVLMAEEFDNEVKEEKQYVLPGGEGGNDKSVFGIWESIQNHLTPEYRKRYFIRRLYYSWVYARFFKQYCFTPVRSFVICFLALFLLELSRWTYR